MDDGTTTGEAILQKLMGDKIARAALEGGCAEDRTSFVELLECATVAMVLREAYWSPTGRHLEYLVDAYLVSLEMMEEVD